MGTWLFIAAAFAPQAAEAQAAPPSTQQVAPLAAERGVIAYPPAFFADIRPVSAYDMVIRVPGFTFDKGSTVRGLEGSGGNVLIDGHPPLAKNDPLEDILRRIPADSVAHVEVIRGGAPGIDMEGRSVLANVVRKQVAGFRGSVQPYFDAVSVGVVDGRPVLDLPYEEDSRAEVDLNVVATESGHYVELQGTAEQEPFHRDALDAMLTLADKGIADLIKFQRATVDGAR
jgi:hypothetical protein